MVKFSPIRKIGLVVKHHQREAGAYASDLVEFLLSHRVKIYFADESKALVKEIQKKQELKKSVIQVVAKTELPSSCDLLIVLGGDGTFLSVARLMKTHSVPIMGINMGQLGFLTEIKREEALNVLQKLISGHSPSVHYRPLLEVTLIRKGKTLLKELVVNDAVVSKGAIARIIGMEVWIDHHWVCHLRADGIIVGTTTGSTAYALAAGGPIIEPSVRAFVIAPISAHSLTLRPLVVSDQSEIRIRLSDRPGPVVLTLDGQTAVELKKDDEILLQKFHKHSIQVLSSPYRDYFSLLREKLKFGARD